MYMHSIFIIINKIPFIINNEYEKKNKKKQNINSIVIPLSLFISILHLINIGYKIKFIYY